MLGVCSLWTDPNWNLGTFVIWEYATVICVICVFRYFSVPSGNIGVYDPTEIHKRGQLKKHMRDCLIFLAWYLVSFFVYLYW